MLLPILAAMSTLALPVHASSPETPGLCVGIRGNGFKIFSTTNALARIVENAGVPDKLVGGSSASIALFLADSAAMNPWIDDPGAEPAHRMALLLKSVPVFLSEITRLPEFEAASRLAGDKLEREKAQAIFKTYGGKHGFGKIAYAVYKYATSATFRNLAKIQRSLYLKELIDPEFLAYMKRTSELTDEAQIRFRQSQIKLATSNLTAFGIQNFDSLFFTPDFITVNGLAKLGSRIGSFFAAYNLDDRQRGKFKAWLDRCTPLAVGKTFEELEKTEPGCSSEIHELARKYIRNYDKLIRSGSKTARFRFNDPIGTRIDTYASASTIIGEGVTSYEEALKRFESATDASDAKNFHIALSDFRIGYFGNPEALNNSVQELLRAPLVDPSGRVLDFTQDFKTRHTFALGRKTWQEAIISSGSEPSRTRPKPTTDASGTKVLTFGGWTDPYPAQLLKGMGCATTAIIVTSSKPTPTALAENVIRKMLPELTGFDHLSPADAAYGNSDRVSGFGRWRNIANPESSDARAANAADAVYCSLWNDESPYSAELGLDGSINRLSEVGYNAHLYIPRAVPQAHPVRSWNIPAITREDLRDEIEPGRPRYAGCIVAEEGSE